MRANGQWTIQRWHSMPAPDSQHNELIWRVGGLSKQENIEVITLANLGMTLKTISQFTGLTPGQVSYRLHVFGIRVSDFREGRGPIAQMVFERLANRVTKQSIQLVREKLV